MKIKLYLLTIFGAICITIIIFILTYIIAFYISPPYAMVDGKRRQLMVIPQLMTAFFVSLVLFIPINFFLFKKIKAFLTRKSH